MNININPDSNTSTNLIVNTYILIHNGSCVDINTETNTNFKIETHTHTTIDTDIHTVIDTFSDIIITIKSFRDMKK